MPYAALPPQVHIFVRDWLSSNNVLLKSRDGHVVIDSGYARHAPLTLALLASARGLGDDSLAFLVNTHCHSDHVGGNAAIVRTLRLPDRRARRPKRRSSSVGTARRCCYDYCDHHVERFAVDHVLPANTTHVWGDLEWQALAAPGHDMGALVFYNAEHRILISGDALWEYGFGFVMPPEVDPAALPATRATHRDARRPRHPHRDSRPRRALHRRRRGARAGAQAPRRVRSRHLRIARHALKVNLMFSLLDKQRMPVAAMPAYLDARRHLPRLQCALLPPAAGATGRVADRRAGEDRRRQDRRGRPGSRHRRGPLTTRARRCRARAVRPTPCKLRSGRSA